MVYPGQKVTSKQIDRTLPEIEESMHEFVVSKTYLPWFGVCIHCISQENLTVAVCFLWIMAV